MPKAKTGPRIRHHGLELALRESLNGPGYIASARCDGQGIMDYCLEGLSKPATNPVIITGALARIRIGYLLTASLAGVG
jgi:hypothetical protein